MEESERQHEQGEVRDGGPGDDGGGGDLVLKKGPWTAVEDAILVAYVQKHGEGNWNSLRKHSGLLRCGKSCRLRWANHLRPNLKKGAFTREEERLIIELHAKLGNKWARMAAQLPGRTDNEIKNYWNTRIKRRQRAGLPVYPLDLQNLPVHSSCLLGQSDSASLSSSLDSEGDLVPSLKTESHGFKLTSFQKKSQSCSSPVCDYTLDSVPSSSLNLPTCAGNPVKSMKRSASSLSYSAEYEKITFPQLSDESSEGVLPNAKAKRFCVVSSSAEGFPLEPDPGIGSHFSSIPSRDLAFVNGFYTLFGLDSCPKMELPSDQCVEAADNAGVLAPAFSSPFTTLSLSKSVGSRSAYDCISNSGLLESLLQESEAKGRRTPRDQTFVHKLENFSVGGESKNLAIDYSTPTALSGSYPATAGVDSISANVLCNWKYEISLPPSMPIIKVEESSGALACSYPSTDISPISDLWRPDGILASDWNNTKFYAADSLAWPRESLSESDFFSLVKGPGSGRLGHIPMVANHFWELGSCQWNNMPGACQIGDYQPDFRHFPPMAEQFIDPCAIF
ncbi:hypothetical protein O6H91_10G086000 [Diphasiastrum complanatum]|uniref:Uncharacterized protein n=1 Tax=Diphasiastrum complanatum TaxID=34168 RepID=A0ACC2CJ04_DIPCM|nr:hypothetical protein O6H91_10G086000 [Diphasiastrum complanatum]